VPGSFEIALRAALVQPPGTAAQLRMAPRPRGIPIPGEPRTAAALLLLYPHDDHWHLPLIVRGSGLRTHTGQVALPGGSVDPGESIVDAALREASEEIGVPPHTVTVVGELTPLFIPVSGYLLHPVVGLAAARPDFRLDAWEVAHLLEVPLATLQDPAIVRHEQRTRNTDEGTVVLEIPFFDVAGQKVWGATAMVLAEFLALLESIGGAHPES